MNLSDWKTFLTEYKGELLSYEEVVESLSKDLIRGGWLGCACATEDEIAAVEKRLATR